MTKQEARIMKGNRDVEESPHPTVEKKSEGGIANLKGSCISFYSEKEYYITM